MDIPPIDPTQFPLGSYVTDKGAAFRVWAPNADSVSLIGSFNDWEPDGVPMEKDESGVWSVYVEGAKDGDEYKYSLTNGEEKMDRVDPRAIEVTASNGNSILRSRDFEWGESDFHISNHNQLVIYELHAKTFPEDQSIPGLEAVIPKLAYLAEMGINAIEIMPVGEFPGDLSWGYNPSHPFAVESSYGGPLALKNLVKAAHEAGIAVILDVVYNHFGPADLDLWRFDGWSENDGGGIYFYNDWRAETPWGATRPDYGRDEVRSYIFDNAMMWLEEFKMDGLRYDATLFMRNVREHDNEGSFLEDGWSLTRWINQEIRERFPERILIAEDLKNNSGVTKSIEDGGSGFHAQWDASFVFPIRDQLGKAQDEWRSVETVEETLLASFNGDALQRVIYTESHDEVAEGKAKRVPQDIQDDEDADGYFAQKLSCLGAGLLFTCPGIPMIFQGQEFLQGGAFSDEIALEWELAEKFQGIRQMYRDLIFLRQNRERTTGGLCGTGISVFHLNKEQNVIAFQRFSTRGKGDDVVVVCNFGNEERDGYRIGMPTDGPWKLRFNSDARTYSSLFGGTESSDLEADGEAADGLEHSGLVRVAGYSTLIYSQDPD